MGAYTKVPSNMFEHLQFNAGIIVDGFNPNTGTLEASTILGASTNGFTFNANPEYYDLGEDVDNLPNNTMELKRLKSYDPTLSGTFVSVTKELMSRLQNAEFGGESAIKFMPPSQLTEESFQDIWYIGDYGTSGFIAIHLINALNTNGLQITTSKENKGQFAFEYHGHYSIEDNETPPFEVYMKDTVAAA